MATLREVKKRIRTVVSRLIFVVIVLTLLTASSTSGFDGNRKGFVLGGGLGFAPTSGWSGKVFDLTSSQVIDTSEYRAGAGFNFLIGHGWDERNMIVFELNMSRWISELLAVQRSSGQIETRPSILQGFIGAVWYHYFGLPGRSLFTAVGFSQYRFIRIFSSSGEQRLGGGFMLGGGYEFARHFQLGAYLGLGSSTERYDTWLFNDFKILLSAVAF